MSIPKVSEEIQNALKSSEEIQKDAEFSQEIQIDDGVSQENQEVQTKPEESIWTKQSIYRAWLLLCFSTGPVASMSRTYVPASIQSIARAVGKTSAGKRCAFRGNDCFVKFGAGTVHFTSYVLYLRAISTALEGFVAILLMGIADYSNYRKTFLVVSIFLYGVWALPYAGLTEKNYPTLKASSALYALLTITNAIYQILEGSYIPLFMRAAAPKGSVPEEVRRATVLKRGSVVSVMGIFLGNCGGIVALLIGIIISYGRGGPIANGYFNFLLAITIAGAITCFFAIGSYFFIPNVPGKPKPKGEFLLFLTAKRFVFLMKDIQKYPNAFLYCLAWVIWNVSNSNFLSLYVLLFRSTLGLGSSDSEYTVFTFMQYVVASMGSLTWMYLYPRTRLHIKTWGYGFLAVSLFTNFWGCLGISDNTLVGFKHRWEFWLFEIFYTATSSSMRSLNRVIYSSLLPEGEEAQYFGLEIMLGVATGWIGSLVNATIQDRTGNDRYPFLPNLFLVAASIIIYYFVDTEKGMRDAEKLVSDTTTSENSISTQSDGKNYQSTTEDQK